VGGVVNHTQCKRDLLRSTLLALVVEMDEHDEDKAELLEQRVANQAVIGLGYVAEHKHAPVFPALGLQLMAAHDTRAIPGWLDAMACGEPYECGRSGAGFWRYLDEHDVDWLVVCTPSLYHVVNIVDGLRRGCNVLCEKPLVLTLEELDVVREAEQRYGGRVVPVLQLRFTEQAWQARHYATAGANVAAFEYHAQRGPWIWETWKVDEAQSGGILMNFGIHMFDMCCHLLGPALGVACVELASCGDVASGFTTHERGEVQWRISFGPRRTQRRLEIGKGRQRDLHDFSMPADAHAKVYEKALQGGGVTLDEVETSLRCVDLIRQSRKVSNA